ncbi:hypothetical protein EDD36DRAFT_22680 [Exophiala viscosa]|uniref:Uncharacterized protein n=1 Tax=Exophiala viscosa TaxID=2486360 RepID=A0AAN6E4U6_9EURO|nr:hypothetical protein EDD36DRAFT_22680 [Exophiala viscosa]
MLRKMRRFLPRLTRFLARKPSPTQTFPSPMSSKTEDCKADSVVSAQGAPIHNSSQDEDISSPMSDKTEDVKGASEQGAPIHNSSQDEDSSSPMSGETEDGQDDSAQGALISDSPQDEDKGEIKDSTPSDGGVEDPPQVLVVDDPALRHYCLLHHTAGHSTNACRSPWSKKYPKRRDLRLRWEKLLDGKGIPQNLPLGRVPVTVFGVMRHAQRMNEFLSKARSHIAARDALLWKCREVLEQYMPKYLATEFDVLVSMMCCQNDDLLGVIQQSLYAIRLEIVDNAIIRAMLQEGIEDKVTSFGHHRLARFAAETQHPLPAPDHARLDNIIQTLRGHAREHDSVTLQGALRVGDLMHPERRLFNEHMLFQMCFQVVLDLSISTAPGALNDFWGHARYGMHLFMWPDLEKRRAELEERMDAFTAMRTAREAGAQSDEG